MTGQTINKELIIANAKRMAGDKNSLLNMLIKNEDFDTIMTLFCIKPDGSVRLFEERLYVGR